MKEIDMIHFKCQYIMGWHPIVTQKYLVPQLEEIETDC